MSRPNAAVPSPPLLPEKSLYRTQSLSFTSACVASGLLPYVRTELNARGYAVFCLDDPNAQGEELKRRFDAGIFVHVEPKNLFATRAFLLEEMTRVKGTDHARK